MATAVLVAAWVTWAVWGCKPRAYLNLSYDEEASAGNCRGFFVTGPAAT
jgi:hypothetical protein